MTSVHGISVTGGTFPASIWHLFMQSAIGSTPVRDWTTPRVLPVWKPFVGAQYALQYRPAPQPAPVAPPPAATTTATTAPSTTTGSTSTATLPAQGAQGQ
jgi:hypothetical protein